MYLMEVTFDKFINTNTFFVGSQLEPELYMCT